MNLFGGGDDDKKSEKKSDAGGAPANQSVAGSNAGGDGEDGGAKVGNMPEGDYIIHVLIQSAKCIKLEGEYTSDPFIKLSCMGIDKSTKNKKDITTSETVKFDEHIFLEYQGLKKEALEEANLMFDI